MSPPPSVFHEQPVILGRKQPGELIDLSSTDPEMVKIRQVNIANIESHFARMQKGKLVALGVAGVGKSTFSLGLTGGQAKFKSGRSIGAGILPGSKDDPINYTMGNLDILNVPGLDDAEAPAAAAKIVTDTLNEGGLLYLVFIARTEAGRLRMSDPGAINRILTGLRKAVGDDVVIPYSILFNQEDEYTIEDMQSYYNRQKIISGLSKLLVDKGKGLASIMFNQTDRRLRGKSCAVVTVSPEILGFISGLTPVHVKEGKVEEIECKTQDELYAIEAQLMQEKKKADAEFAELAEKHKEEMAKKEEELKKKLEAAAKEAEEKAKLSNTELFMAALPHLDKLANAAGTFVDKAAEGLSRVAASTKSGPTLMQEAIGAGIRSAEAMAKGQVDVLKQQAEAANHRANIIPNITEKLAGKFIDRIP